MIRFLSNQVSSSTHGRSSLGLGRHATLKTTQTPHNHVRRSKSSIAIQLDYYMSPQFAGIACAMTEGLYEKAGIDNLNFLPICPVGLEMERVRNHRSLCSDNNNDDVVVGSVEQNIFTPLLYENPNLKLKAIASMFRTSPLCLASIGDDSNNNNSNSNDDEAIVVGAHEDTVSLMKRILNKDSSKKYSVIASPRATKNTDLLDGKLGLIQAYTTTEVPTLERHGATVNFIPLEGLNGAKLGYSQMLFTPEEDLIGEDKREILQAFLDATFSGWEMAIRDIEDASMRVEEAKRILHLDDESNDHWGSSKDYSIQNVGLCGDYVKDTFQGDRYGVIDAKRWNEANAWLLDDNDDVVESNFGFDPTVWQPSPKILAGNELASISLDDARKSALDFYKTHGRKPSLAVITVGKLSRYTHSDRRIKIYSNDRNSWFNKTSTGENNGFHVKEINLPDNTTTEELLSEIYKSKDFDGIQLMWPLPGHIDSGRAYKAIEIDCDVDGAHFIGQIEIDPSSSPLPPVTPAAAMELMDNYNIDLKGKNVLVVGRSRIVGSPMAHMLRARDAVVTVAHSQVSKEDLTIMVGSADVVVSCVGEPGVLDASWLKQDSVVINIGTTFSEDHDSLFSDFGFEDNLASNEAVKQFSPVPGGVGPLSVAQLYKNVARAAWQRASKTGDVEATWQKKSSSLHRSIHFVDYDAALSFANKVNTMSSEMDHHANLSFTHKCVNGVDVELEYFSFEANELTDKDYEAARKVNEIILKEEGEKIKMSDYTYNLQFDSIAKYPAEPRGSSRLLNVDTDGNVRYFDNFSDSILPFLSNAHVIFNESKVVNARLSVNSVEYSDEKGGIEMMVLDLGENLEKTCADAELTVMIRKEEVRVGEIFEENVKGSASFVVVAVKGPWIEDEKSNGNGTECTVKCLVEDTNIRSVSELLRSVGSVPIPPYLDRDAEASDEHAYNNVYASGEGSVAAPTAGLHFTDPLLAKIGQDNISYLSLHVGAGTFKPVVAEDVRDHAMHGETFVVSVGELQRIIESLESRKRLVVVGTTSSRTLESLYWCGVKKILEDRHKDLGFSAVGDDNTMVLGQHEWSDLELLLAKDGLNITAVDALKAVIKDKSHAESISGRTSLMIFSGYKFKIVEDLITNFHAPDSTLMLLVSAFLGNPEKVRSVYENAQDRGYRFLSYGDACYFSRPKETK
jgi:S-adenosylmethionine:tRNA ribosyltransferase-isomerase